jgi:FXSXX-COOH protein
VEQPPADFEPVLVDLTSISLNDLDILDESPLADCLRRLRDDVQNDTTIVAGFQSAL